LRFIEAIHAAHGLGFFAVRGGDMQVTVSVDFRNELPKPFAPPCGLPPSSPVFECVQSRAQRSADQGRSWQLQPVDPKTNRSVTEFSNYAFQFDDGEMLQFTGVQLGAPEIANGSAMATVPMEIIRSNDGAKTQNRTAAQVTAPAGLLAEGWLSTSHSAIVQLRDGTLVTNAYAPWIGQDGFNEPAKRSKTRVVVLRSADRGRSWQYASTVAWDPVNATVAEDRSSDCGVDGVCNGFDEATLVVAPNAVGYGGAGETIVCFMRSGGPLFRAFSMDGGASWSTPNAIAPHGVSPQAIVMAPSNILVLAYGRPDNYLRFSLDGGRTFLREVCYNKVAVQPYDGGEYDSVIQIPGTDTLLLTYAASTTAYDMQIMGLYINVTRF
jgi:hypothetical protein